MSSSAWDDLNLSGDGIQPMDDSKIMLMKVERTLLAFGFIILLIVACRNVWVFLYQKRMYRSYPLTLTYIFIIVFSIIEIGYNMTMLIACGTHDCVSNLVIQLDDTEEHILQIH